MKAKTKRGVSIFKARKNLSSVFTELKSLAKIKKKTGRKNLYCIVSETRNLLAGIMASFIEKYGVDRLVIRLFEERKTTREILAVVNKRLKEEGKKPISLPTVANYVKPYREQQDKDRRQLVVSTFTEDLQKLNACINQNFAIANGHRLDPETGAVKRGPNGKIEIGYYEPQIKQNARKQVIDAIFKKFEFLGEDSKTIYHEVSGKDGGPVQVSQMEDEALDARINDLQKKLKNNEDAFKSRKG